MSNQYEQGFSTTGRSPLYTVRFEKKPAYRMRLNKSGEKKVWEILTLDADAVIGTSDTAMEAVGKETLAHVDAHLNGKPSSAPKRKQAAVEDEAVPQSKAAKKAAKRAERKKAEAAA